MDIEDFIENIAPICNNKNSVTEKSNYIGGGHTVDEGLTRKSFNKEMKKKGYKVKIRNKIWKIMQAAQKKIDKITEDNDVVFAILVE